MKQKGYKHKALAVFLSALATAGTAQADMDIMGGKATISGEITAGVQQKYVDGANEKFEEYRDVVNGALLHDFRFKAEGNASPYYLDVKVKNPLQDNELYKVKGGLHGKFGIGLFYDSTPHNFASGKLLLSGAGTGNLTIADRIQKDLELAYATRANRTANPPFASANPFNDPAYTDPFDGSATTKDAFTQQYIRDLYNNTNPMVFKLKREKTGFSFDYNVTDDIKTWAKVSNEKRNGTRVLSTGTYERWGVTGGNLFLVSGTELAEPIDYRTTVLNVGTGVYKKNWLADAEYTFTSFENKIDALRWDDPFSFNNYEGVSAGSYDRSRFKSGQLALPVDSQSHDFTVSGSIDLPLHSKFTGTVSYGWVTQDEKFLPFTLNSAIVTGVPAGLVLTNPAVSKTGQDNLDGKVATLTQSYVLTSKPVEPLTLTAKYKYYDYDNSSDRVEFDGFAAYGESYWRTVRSGAGVDNGVISKPLSYTRQNAEISADYHVAKPLTVSVEGFWEDWDRENLRIDSTTELGVGAGFIYKPAKTVNLKGGYKYAHRSVDGYTEGSTGAAPTENPEAVGLRNYDWAERKRQKADLRLQLLPLQSLTVAVSGQYLKDDLADGSLFGLKKSEHVVGAVDVSYNPSDNLSLYANYAKEYRKGFMQNASKTAVPFAVSDYWNTDIYEKVDTVGVGVALQVIPEKLSFDTSYNLSYAKMDFVNTNPNGVSTTNFNAIAEDWSRVRNRLHEVKAQVGYNFTKNLKAVVSYLYEWYKLDDFANTPAYMAGTSAGPSEENSTRFTFTGANNYSYEAHVAGAYLNWKF